MKIIAFSSGTLVSLFPLEAFSPMAGLNERQIIGAIGQRYNFGSSPDMSSRADLEQTGLVFDMGVFATQWGEITIHRLSIHNDGVLIRANKTEHAEAFFGDMSNWLVRDYECRQIGMKSLYSSEIVVEFEKPAAGMFDKYDRLIEIVLSNIDENREAGAAAFNALSIEFVSTSTAMPKFIIERREGTSVEDERYFCSAPLTTERHLQVLGEIERLFS